MFDDISDNKKDLPKIKSIEKEVGKYQFNGYQKFAIITYKTYPLSARSRAS